MPSLHRPLSRGGDSSVELLSEPYTSLFSSSIDRANTSLASATAQAPSPRRRPPPLSLSERERGEVLPASSSSSSRSRHASSTSTSARPPPSDSVIDLTQSSPPLPAASRNFAPATGSGSNSTSTSGSRAGRGDTNTEGQASTSARPGSTTHVAVVAPPRSYAAASSNPRAATGSPSSRADRPSIYGTIRASLLGGMRRTPSSSATPQVSSTSNLTIDEAPPLRTSSHHRGLPPPPSSNAAQGSTSASGPAAGGSADTSAATQPERRRNGGLFRAGGLVTGSGANAQAGPSGSASGPGTDAGPGLRARAGARAARRLPSPIRHEPRRRHYALPAYPPDLVRNDAAAARGGGGGFGGGGGGAAVWMEQLGGMDWDWGDPRRLFGGAEDDWIPIGGYGDLGALLSEALGPGGAWGGWVGGWVGGGGANGGPAGNDGGRKGPEYAVAMSHPRQPENNFSRGVLPLTEESTTSSTTTSGKSTSPGIVALHPVPVCASCDNPLLLEQGGTKRPWALRCGHVVCGDCMVGAKERASELKAASKVKAKSKAGSSRKKGAVTRSRRKRPLEDEGIGAGDAGPMTRSRRRELDWDGHTHPRDTLEDDTFEEIDHFNEDFNDLNAPAHLYRRVGPGRGPRRGLKGKGSQPSTNDDAGPSSVDGGRGKAAFHPVSTPQGKGKAKAVEVEVIDLSEDEGLTSHSSKTGGLGKIEASTGMEIGMNGARVGWTGCPVVGCDANGTDLLAKEMTDKCPIEMFI